MNILVTDGAGHFGPTTSGPTAQGRQCLTGRARTTTAGPARTHHRIERKRP